MANLVNPPHPALDDPAFPTSFAQEGPFGGLTKREIFAMSAMQGLLAYPGRLNFGEKTGKVTDEQLANLSVKCADALLAELNRV